MFFQLHFPGIFLALNFFDDGLVALLVEFESLRNGLRWDGFDGFLYHLVVNGQQDFLDGKLFSPVPLLSMVVNFALVIERSFAERAVIRLDFRMYEDVFASVLPGFQFDVANRTLELEETIVNQVFVTLHVRYVRKTLATNVAQTWKLSVVLLDVVI